MESLFSYSSFETILQRKLDRYSALGSSESINYNVQAVVSCIKVELHKDS